MQLFIKIAWVNFKHMIHKTYKYFALYLFLIISLTTNVSFAFDEPSVCQTFTETVPPPASGDIAEWRTSIEKLRQASSNAKQASNNFDKALDELNKIASLNPRPAANYEAAVIKKDRATDIRNACIQDCQNAFFDYSAVIKNNKPRNIQKKCTLQ